ncbi:type III secretion HpaP family protein [Dyella subtropica]|uniref:type III secretion HpaP family protein n=1 Tax=Dyella subtropica TaxID=2992127 RepID=UPI00225210B4|nr:type III secretion HpaP family protein [Dyella subtropica]
MKSRPANAAHGHNEGEHENVQRFRALMHAKQAGRVDGADANADAAVAMDADALSPDQEQALRELLQRQLSESGDRSLGALARHQDDGDDDGQQGDERGDGQNAASIGMQALHQTQQALFFQTVEQPGASRAAMAPALAELIERHVKQLLVPDASSRSSAQSHEIMITLKDGLLPGTELWLSRTSTGWTLRADTRSSTAYRSLLDGAPQLIERFAQSRLGVLEIVPTLLA